MATAHAQKQAQLAIRRLEKWQSGEVELWSYQRAHRSLEFRVSKLGVEGCLLLFCGDVRRYAGPLSWSSADLNVSCTVDTSDGDDIYTLLDADAGAMITAAVLEVRELEEAYPKR